MVSHFADINYVMNEFMMGGGPQPSQSAKAALTAQLVQRTVIVRPGSCKVTRLPSAGSNTSAGRNEVSDSAHTKLNSHFSHLSRKRAHIEARNKTLHSATGNSHKSKHKTTNSVPTKLAQPCGDNFEKPASSELPPPADDDQRVRLIGEIQPPPVEQEANDPPVEPPNDDDVDEAIFVRGRITVPVYETSPFLDLWPYVTSAGKFALVAGALILPPMWAHLATCAASIAVTSTFINSTLDLCRTPINDELQNRVIAPWAYTYTDEAAYYASRIGFKANTTMVVYENLFARAFRDNVTRNMQLPANQTLLMRKWLEAAKTRACEYDPVVLNNTMVALTNHVSVWNARLKDLTRSTNQVIPTLTNA